MWSLSQNSKKLLLTWRGTTAQTGHNDFAVRDIESSESFIATSEVGAHLCVTTGCHIYGHYTAKRKRLLREAFVVDEVGIRARHVSIGYGYAQHADSKWCDDLCLRCHSCLVLEGRDQPDGIALSYGASIALGSRTALAAP